jgi:hypothetical protein
MAALSETQVVALELEKVLPKVQTVFERDDKFFANIQKKNVEVVSYRQMRVPLELRPGGSFQYFNPDGGDLGRGGAQQWDKATLQPVFMSQNIEYTKLTDWATNGNTKAVQSSTRQLVAKALLEFRRQIDSQYMQAGNGVVGTISVVSTAAGVDTYTLGTDGFGARLVRYGQTIQVWDSTLATNRGSGEISYWDVVNKQIKVPAIAGATAGDLLVVKGISSPTSIPAIYGVPYQHSNASTGTWLGFSRSATPEIRSNGVNASSAALTLPLPRLAINAIGNRVGIDNDMAPNAWMHPCQVQAYEEIGQLVSIIQKQAKAEGLNMYFGENGMQMAGASVRTSFSWDKTRIDFVSNEVWGRGEILPIGFYTTDGRKIFELRGPSGGIVTADIFYMVNGHQAFVNNPAATAYIYTLAVPSGY